MSHAFAARGARQTAVLAAILGLHCAVFLAVALGLVPKLPPSVDKPYVVRPLPPPVEKPAVHKPRVELMPGWLIPVERPDVDIPDFAPVAKEESGLSQNPRLEATGGAGTAGMGVVLESPKLRTRPASVAAAINACYPAASRRMNEEGTVVALVTIGAAGSAVDWSVAQSSGFARLDSAIPCVLGKLDFVAGRRDGQAVSAEARLPIVFRLD